MENFLIKLLVALGVGVLQSDLLVREEHEVEDQNLCGLLQGILRVYGTVRCHLNDEIVVVGLLLDTSRLNTVANIADRGVDRIDRKYIDIRAILTVLVSRYITTSLVDSKVNLERCLGV